MKYDNAARQLVKWGGGESKRRIAGAKNKERWTENKKTL